ncbi:hypothetical protein ACQ86N_21855 [Puia sp. P3]|uniref:hypothetical protein n=1 Tax=Puia sp. P3 TaxID=3423952 RepID=UPI003D676A78
MNIADFIYGYKQKDTKDGDVYFFSLMMYVMHEYGHYGDHVTNNGKSSGEGGTGKDELAESTDRKVPIQLRTSLRCIGEQILTMLCFMDI